MKSNLATRRPRVEFPQPIDHIVISSASGDMIQLDIEDAELAEFSWSNDGRGYPRSGSQELTHKYLHREVMARTLGRPLSRSELVDHRNHDIFDNRRTNLRIATYAQNQHNCRPNRGTVSRHKGVSLTPSSKWIVSISSQRISHYIGVFSSEAEAAWMYDQWALALHGEFAYTNFDYV